MYYDGFVRRTNLYYKHMVSSSSLCKNKEVLTRNGGGKWDQHHCHVGSMSLLNMALVCIRVGLGTFHHVFHLPPWVWVILFDLSFALCLVILTFDLLMSNTTKLTVVPFICSREVDLCKKKIQPSSDSRLILIHKRHYVPLSCVDDVGNTMAHLLSRSLPFDFSSLSRKLI